MWGKTMIKKPFKSQSAYADNVWVKMMYLLNQGDQIQGHAHTFDHITLLARGSVRMEHDLGSKEYKAPFLIITPKGIVHKFTALESRSLLCCIHAIRDGDEVDDIAPQNITTEEAERLMFKYPLTKD
jgi:quercetin dioxygenase-like cupin family protein